MEDNTISITSLSPLHPKKSEFDEDFIIDNSSLTRTVLFVCDFCDGPLVPSSLCTICKKTVTRVCVKCGNAKKTSPHTICCDLILLGSMIKRDSHQKADNV